MATLVELREREELLPSEMKRFGNRVRYFSVEVGNSTCLKEAKEKTYQEIEEHIKKTGGQLYTGIHSETDWTRTRTWWKGSHLVNRTLEFAVLAPLTPSTPMYDGKTVKCPLCGSTSIRELGAGNDEAGYACDQCKVTFLISGLEEQG